MSSIIKCPHCNREFTTEPLEEILHPTLTVSRTVSEYSSWEEIANVIKDGQAYRLFGVGDSISTTLKNGKTVQIDVAAMNPYAENSVAFVFSDLNWQTEMNERSTNAGGWSKCKARRFLRDEVLPLLPDDLVSVISERKIVQIIDGTRYESDDKLWLPSRTEVFGATDEYKDIDSGDIHFPIFNTEKKRVKCLEDGTTYPWWERSPYYNYSDSFCGVNTDGDANGYSAYPSFGVAPAFKV